MKHSKLNYLIVAAAATILVSCHKDKKVSPNTTPTAERAGLYVLDQGNLGSPNSALTYYDFTTKTLTPDIFLSANGIGLGNTANDIEVYGSKMYIVVDKSGTVQVVDPKTAKIIKTVLFQTNQKSNEPRDIAFYKSNAYISMYNNNVAVMDTATLTITKTIAVGRNPEQLVVANGKLYVANGGGLSYPDVDSTVSVIDLATLKVTKTITVGSNPYAISADANGHVFVTAYGVYQVSNSTLTVINDATDAVISKTDFTGGPFTYIGNTAYFIDLDGTVKTYNTQTLTAGTTNFVTDGTTFTAAFAIKADPITGEVFVTDAKDYNSNGTLYAFDKNGKKEYTITTGIDPGSIAFVNK